MTRYYKCRQNNFAITIQCSLTCCYDFNSIFEDDKHILFKIVVYFEKSLLDIYSCFDFLNFCVEITHFKLRKKSKLIRIFFVILTLLVCIFMMPNLCIYMILKIYTCNDQYEILYLVL